MRTMLQLLAVLVMISVAPFAEASKHTSTSVADSLSSPFTRPASPNEGKAAAHHDEHDVFIDALSERTWSYLSSDWATDAHLPWSWRSESIAGGDYVNPAEIGFYALSWLAAYDLQRPWSPTWEETQIEVLAILDRLRGWQTGAQTFQPNGPNAYGRSVFYQWYWINAQEPVVGAGVADHVVPSIDNAWLAVSLITIREYAEGHGHAVMAAEADAILANMNFLIWYDFSKHRFFWGAPEDPLGGGEIDYFSNENRIINFVAHALGQLDDDEFLASLDALVQNPAIYKGIVVDKVSWDGSYFTYAGPALFVREMQTQYGLKTILPATEAQIRYAQNEGYRAWGLSDCFDVGVGGYLQQGALPVATASWPETRDGLISPHASALALITPLASDALSNLQFLSETYPLVYDTRYGFRDSVVALPGDSQEGIPSARFSALNQEWLLLALVNYQTGFIWNYFYLDEGVRYTHQLMYDPALEMVYIPGILHSDGVP